MITFLIMKAIKLTKEQKDKLLEMCEKLFPEYQFEFGISVTGNSYKHLFEFKTEEYLTINESEEPYNDLIHWLEFLLFYIVPKIDRPYTRFGEHNHWSDCDISLREYFSGSMFSLYKFGQTHPVDYIYSKFTNEKCEYEVILGQEGATDCGLCIKKNFDYNGSSSKEFLIESPGWNILEEFWDIFSQKMTENAKSPDNQELLGVLFTKHRLFN